MMSFHVVCKYLCSVECEKFTIIFAFVIIGVISQFKIGNCIYPIGGFFWSVSLQL